MSELEGRIPKTSEVKAPEATGTPMFKVGGSGETDLSKPLVRIPRNIAEIIAPYDSLLGEDTDF